MMIQITSQQLKIACLLLLGFVFSCAPSKEERQVQLYNGHCASCHLAPNIQDLPKDIWANNILPEMGARMGLKNTGYDPKKGASYTEQEAILKSKVFPYKPTISQEDWDLLQAYILDLAPDSIPSLPKEYAKELDQFIPKPITLPGLDRSLITYFSYDSIQNQLFTGDISGLLATYSFTDSTYVPIQRFLGPVTGYAARDTVDYVTSIGKLDPSEVATGSMALMLEGKPKYLPMALHRPVHTLVADLNKNGSEEVVVCEFGYFSGKLSILSRDGYRFKKEILINRPGATRTLAKDMNGDGKEDLIVLFSQGDESISILYQEDDLNFREEKVLRFNPLYGSSWFELVDYDGDGDDDIITVNGDNADKSNILKPYHGMRIHINDGTNTFTETYFYPMYGATRLVAEDFDADGDIDFGLLSTFPDYDKKPEYSFVYLENTNEENYNFTAHTFKDSNLNRWFLMDTGDVDKDGDQDIILSGFSYFFAPIPDELSKLWDTKNAHVMILENKTIMNK